MTTYLIDSTNSSVNFSVKHMMIAKVRGGFEKFSGKLIYDESNPEATQVEATIETNSITTRDVQRDTHLKSAEFFDVKTYPHITFISRRVVAGKEALKIVGDLTIHGVTQSVSLDVKAPSVKIGFSATTKIKRREFGLTWNAALEAGGLLVGDEVSVSLDIHFVKQA